MAELNERIKEFLDEEQEETLKHLPGRHNQKLHGNRRTSLHGGGDKHVMGAGWYYRSMSDNNLRQTLTKNTFLKSELSAHKKAFGQRLKKLGLTVYNPTSDKDWFSYKE